jgi:protein-disulfide isomerase
LWAQLLCVLESSRRIPDKAKAEAIVNKRVENAISITLAACALALTGVYFFDRLAVSRAALPEKPQRVANWEEMLSSGHRIGPPSAAAQIVAFNDFQCPFCKIFHARAESLLTEFRGDVSVVFVQLPIAAHQHAAGAAQAADCASAQQKFGEMAQQLFAKQDSLGAKEWDVIAADVGVENLEAFSTCMQGDTLGQKAAAYRAFGVASAIVATPTVVVNGWRLPSNPPMDTLRRIVKDIIEKRRPFQ